MSHSSIGYETYCDTLTAAEKKNFDFCLEQDNISLSQFISYDDGISGDYYITLSESVSYDDGSLDDQYKDALIKGNQAYKNGDNKKALLLWEECASQYNPSKYQTTCRKNISNVTSADLEIKTEAIKTDLTLFGSSVN